MRRVAISASSRPAADAAAGVADAGGNAVDAAVAATITAMVSDPGIIGPGAGSFLTIWPPDSDPVVIDGYSAMPGLAAGSISATFGDRVHMDYGGGMDTLVGPDSVAVPGVWAGLGRASARFGALEWADLVGPAIDLTASGFPLSGVSEAYLAYAHDAIYDRTEDSFAALHHPDGSRMADGDTVRIEGLADSLRTIAIEGPESFYTGSIGDRLAAAMGEWGAAMSGADLAAYRAVEREPILVDLDGWQIATNPAPAIGGAVLAGIVLLAGANGFSDWSAASARRLAAVERAVLGYRARELDGSDDIEAAVADLLDAARMGDLGRLTESPSTVHTSTVDTDGLACAVTTSAGYGSGVMIPGTGMWLNNSLGEVELFPSGMDVFAPGDRLASNMAPTVARGPHGGKIALGSPGCEPDHDVAGPGAPQLHRARDVGDRGDRPPSTPRGGLRRTADDRLRTGDPPGGNRRVHAAAVPRSQHVLRRGRPGHVRSGRRPLRGRRSATCGRHGSRGPVGVATVPEFLGLVVDPIRLALLGGAASGPVDVVEVACAFDEDVRRVRKELGRLMAAKLIDSELRLDVEVVRTLARSIPTEAPIDPALIDGPWTPDEAQVLYRFFTGRRLTRIPSSHAKRLLVLERLAAEFEPGVRYDEREVNFTLQMFHDDYAALRRYLVDEEFLTRADGVYWRTGGRVVGSASTDESDA